EQLKKVYEVNIKTQPHPTVAKPQLLMTPAYSLKGNEDHVLQSFALKQDETSVQIQFDQPLRVFSNASISAGIQWLSHFCFVSKQEVQGVTLLQRNENLADEHRAVVHIQGQI